jgi:hypothetical protein
MKSIGYATLNWAFTLKPIQPDGCAWYRCFLPMQELAKFDWSVAMAMPGYDDDHGFTLDNFGKEDFYGWDIIVFKLIMLKTVAERMDEARSKGQKIFVDIDDFFEGLDETNLAYKNTDPKRNDEVNREHYYEIIRKADGVITSTAFLRDYYISQGIKNVFMVRNGIDIDRWRRKRDHSGHLPTVGWVGATPWRSKDLETMRPFFGEFMQKSRMPFHHAGYIKNANQATDQLGLPEITKVTHEPRKPILQYPEMFRKIDIGLVPLNNIPFNHAKSTIKGLEYTAAGIPFIASYSPEYELLSQQGVGRVAYTPEDWIMHLTELQDPKIRKEEIDKNYENLKLTQTMEVRGHEWNEVMEQILAL